jgi:peptidoglycan/LPS O-acetylase OafA/YrhL
MQTTITPRLQHQTHIEGLRAVAILLVVFDHANIPGFSGGFVGVDVFFVISGYLITGLLLTEHAEGRVDYFRFIARRLGRLFPALFVMVVATCSLSYSVLSPQILPEQLAAAAAAMAWYSNFLFAFSELAYFGPSASSNLFLHTWSLGVEQQFYLIWPLILLLAARRGARPDGLSSRLLGLLAGVFVLSLLLSLQLSREQPAFAFYLVPTRAFQFAAGALTWLACTTHPLSQVVAKLLSLAGALCILIAAALLDGTQAYPGGWALLPTVGTAWLIAAAHPRFGNLVAAVLSVRPMLYLGRVSYAWYLWHWPVLLLGAEFILEPKPEGNLVLVGIALLLAALTHLVIERPFRRLCARTPVSHTVLVFVVLIALSSSLLTKWHNQADEWVAAGTEQRVLDARNDIPKIYSLGCDEWYHSDVVKVCSFGNVDATRTAVLIGDSIGLQWFPAFEHQFLAPDWRLLAITKSACPIVDGPYFYPRLRRQYTECATWRQSALALIASLGPDLVIIGSSAFYEFSALQWEQGSARVFDILSPNSEHVIVLRPTPALPLDGPACLSRPPMPLFAADFRKPCEGPAENPANELAWRALSAAAAGYPNVHLLDLNDLVCPDARCRAELRGAIVFRDSMHLTASFADSLSEALGKRLDEAVSNDE